jgi:copper chaperone CopZ
MLSTMSQMISYRVPGMHCDHCKAAVEAEVGGVAGVESIQVDLDRKLVTVQGRGIDDRTVRAAIDEAGYEVE